MSLVRNERLKLLAAALNNTGVATVAALVAPLANLPYAGASLPDQQVLSLGIPWFLVGAALHMAAQWVLGRLKA